MRAELQDAARMARQIRVKLFTAAQQANDAAYAMWDTADAPASEIEQAFELAGRLSELATMADALRARCAREANHAGLYLDVKRHAVAIKKRSKPDG